MLYILTYSNKAQVDPVIDVGSSDGCIHVPNLP